MGRSPLIEDTYHSLQSVGQSETAGISLSPARLMPRQILTSMERRALSRSIGEESSASPPQKTATKVDQPPPCGTDVQQSIETHMQEHESP